MINTVQNRRYTPLITMLINFPRLCLTEICLGTTQTHGTIILLFHSPRCPSGLCLSGITGLQPGLTPANVTEDKYIKLLTELTTVKLLGTLKLMLNIAETMTVRLTWSRID